MGVSLDDTARATGQRDVSPDFLYAAQTLEVDPAIRAPAPFIAFGPSEGAFSSAAEVLLLDQRSLDVSWRAPSGHPNIWRALPAYTPECISKASLVGNYVVTSFPSEIPRRWPRYHDRVTQRERLQVYDIRTGSSASPVLDTLCQHVALHNGVLACTHGGMAETWLAVAEVWSLAESSPTWAHSFVVADHDEEGIDFGSDVLLDCAGPVPTFPYAVYP